MHVVIPIFALNRWRLRGLDVLLDSVSKATVTVSLIEQTNDDRTEARDIFDKYAHRGNLRYVKHEYTGPDLIRKSEMMNRGARLYRDAEYLWIVDADTLLSWGTILEAVQSSRAEAYNPAFCFARLNDAQAEELYRERKIEIAHGTHALTKQPFCPNSMIIRRDVFERVGGFDEGFVGYGWEDVDFILRLLGSGVTYVQLGGVGIHMWHPTMTAVRGSFDRLVKNHPGAFDGAESWIDVVERLSRGAMRTLDAPGLVDLAGSLARTTATWATGGFELASPDERSRRRGICQQCAFWEVPQVRNLMMGRCRSCGCFGLKLMGPGQGCPIGRW